MMPVIIIGGACHPAERRVDDKASRRTRMRDVGGRGRSLRRRRGGMLRDDRTYCKVTRRRMIMNRRMASRASRSVQLQVLH
jgi:hypothetical protein